MLLLFCALLVPGCYSGLSSSVIDDDPGLGASKVQAASLRARGVIELTGIEDREFKGKAAILVKGPDKVRIEIFDIFGQVAAIIVSDPHALSISSNNNSSFFFQGGDTPLDFTAAELVSFLLGALFSVSETGGGAGERRILFDDFRDLEGSRFPFLLSVDDGRERLLVRYSSIELNPELDDALFVHLEFGLP